jgi:hypothetical protein
MLNVRTKEKSACSAKQRHSLVNPDENIHPLHFIRKHLTL